MDFSSAEPRFYEVGRCLYRETGPADESVGTRGNLPHLNKWYKFRKTPEQNCILLYFEILQAL